MIFLRKRRRRSAYVIRTDTKLNFHHCRDSNNTLIYFLEMMMHLDYGGGFEIDV